MHALKIPNMDSFLLNTDGKNSALPRRKNTPRPDHMELARKVLTTKGEILSWDSFILEFQRHQPLVNQQDFKDSFCQSLVPGVLSSPDFICLDTPWNTGLLKLELIVMTNARLHGGKFARAHHYFMGLASKEERKQFVTDKVPLVDSVSDLPQMFILSSDQKAVALEPDAAARHEAFFSLEGDDKRSAIHKLKYFLFLCQEKATVNSSWEFICPSMTKEEMAYLSGGTREGFRQVLGSLQDTFYIEGNILSLRNSCRITDRTETPVPTRHPGNTDVTERVSTSETDRVGTARKILDSRGGILTWKSFTKELRKLQGVDDHQKFRESICKSAIPGFLSSPDFISLDTPWNTGLLKLELIVMTNEKQNQGQFSKASSHFILLASEEERNLFGRSTDALVYCISCLTSFFALASDWSTVTLKPGVANKHKSFFSYADDVKTSAVHKLKYFLFLCHGQTVFNSAFQFSCCLMAKEEKTYLTEGTKEGFTKVLKTLPGVFRVTKEVVSLTKASRQSNKDGNSNRRLTKPSGSISGLVAGKSSKKQNMKTPRCVKKPKSVGTLKKTSPKVKVSKTATPAPNAAKVATSAPKREANKKEKSSSSGGKQVKNHPASDCGLSLSMESKKERMDKSKPSAKSQVKNLPVGVNGMAPSFPASDPGTNKQKKKGKSSDGSKTKKLPAGAKRVSSSAAALEPKAKKVEKGQKSKSSDGSKTKKLPAGAKRVSSSAAALEPKAKKVEKGQKSKSADGSETKKLPASVNRLPPPVAASEPEAKKKKKEKKRKTKKLPAYDGGARSPSQMGNNPGAKTMEDTPGYRQNCATNLGPLSSLSSSIVARAKMTPERKTTSVESTAPLRQNGHKSAVVLQFIKDDTTLALMIGSMQDSESPIVSVTCCNDCLVVLHLAGSGFIVPIPETGFRSLREYTSRWTTLLGFFQDARIVVVMFDCETTARFLLERLDLQLCTIFDVKTAIEVISSRLAGSKIPCSSVLELYNHLGLPGPLPDPQIIGELRTLENGEYVRLDEEQISTTVYEAALLVPGLYSSVTGQLSSLRAMSELYVRTEEKLQAVYTGGIDSPILLQTTKLMGSGFHQTRILNRGSNSAGGSTESSSPTDQDDSRSSASSSETSPHSRSISITKNSMTAGGSDLRPRPFFERDTLVFPTHPSCDSLQLVPSMLFPWTEMTPSPPHHRNGSILGDPGHSSAGEGHSSMTIQCSSRHPLRKSSSTPTYNRAASESCAEVSGYCDSIDSTEFPNGDWSGGFDGIDRKPQNRECSGYCDSIDSTELPNGDWSGCFDGIDSQKHPNRECSGYCDSIDSTERPNGDWSGYCDSTGSTEHPNGERFDWFDMTGHAEASSESDEEGDGGGQLTLCKAEEGDIIQVPMEEAGNYECNLSGLTEETLQEYAAKNTKSMIQLLNLLGDDIADTLERHMREQSNLEELTEIVLDVGRHAEARFHQSSKSEKLNIVVASSKTITVDDLKRVEENESLTTFDDSNCCGIEGTLHSVRGIRNRKRELVGLTIKIGLPLLGAADMMYDLALSGKSTLILGYPGVGKTTLLRELARCLSDNEKKKVVVVDTCNEIAGDGDIPHFSIGSSRHLQVDKPELQPVILLESARNHSPEVIIVDQIDTREDVEAVTRLSRRGIQIIAGSSRDSVNSLISSDSLSWIFQPRRGGFEDAESLDSARALARSKLNPVFEAIVEMKSSDCWYIFDPIHTYSALSEGQSYSVQERRRVWTSDTRSEQQILLKEKIIQQRLQKEQREEVSATMVESKERLTEYIALDCEMVGVGKLGKRSILARVSLVNEHGACIYDKYVAPREVVTNYRTFVSGIRPADLENGVNFTKVRKEVTALLAGRILVGHALHNDLQALSLSHPYSMSRDTSKYRPFRRLCQGRSPGLKKLTELILKVKIQEGEHSSVEDARAAMSLFLKYREEWKQGEVKCRGKRVQRKKKTKTANFGRSKKKVHK